MNSKEEETLKFQNSEELKPNENDNLTNDIVILDSSQTLQSRVIKPVS